MTALLGPLLVLGALGIVYSILSPSASRSVRGMFPRADRSPDRSIAGQTERRGAVLAALAAADLLELVEGTEFVTAASVAVVLAVAFRLAPDPVRYVLATFGLLAATIQVFGPAACDVVVDERRALSIALAVGGVVAFSITRLMFNAAGFGRGSVSILVLYGIVGLGFFVAAPFGEDLSTLLGFGGSLTAVVAAYVAVVVVAALLPDFTVGVVGITLLAARLSVAAVVQNSCDAHQGALIAVLAAFVLVWWMAGRFGADRTRTS